MVIIKPIQNWLAVFTTYYIIVNDYSLFYPPVVLILTLIVKPLDVNTTFPTISIFINCDHNITFEYNNRGGADFNILTVLPNMCYSLPFSY